MISGIFPLFLKVTEPYTDSNSLQLVTHGSSADTSGVFKGLDLFIQGTSVVTANLNLFLSNYGPEDLSGSLNLFIPGQNYSINNSVPLFISNSGTDKALTLFIKGSGITDGAYPFSSSMNLFIERNEANAISLFLQGEGEYISSGITLYSFGAYLASSGIDLVISDVVGISSGTLKLYTHGF